MTEPRTVEALEIAYAGRIRSYTDVAMRRPFDATGTARTAMTPATAAGRASPRAYAGRARRWWVVVVPAAVLVAIGAVVVGGLSQQRRPPEPTGTPLPAASIPESLAHSWSRPDSVSPGEDAWGSGFLILTDGRVDFGREPGAEASSSAIAATGPASLEGTATNGTQGCEPGDAGAYSWLLEGKETVLTLTPITADACAARQTALAGQWVRDFPPQPAFGAALEPGTYTTSTFDPIGNIGTPKHLQYTVPPARWAVAGDDVGSLALQRLPDDPAGDPLDEPLIGIFSNPRLLADYAPGAPCGRLGDAPGVGGALDELVEAIQSKPGVVSTPPAPVTIAGHEGRLLDLRLEAGWTGGCTDDSGPVIGMPLLHQGGSNHGPVAGLGPNRPLRLIMLDLGGGRTLAIAIAVLSDHPSLPFAQRVAEAMPIIESFQVVPATSPTP